MPEVVGACTVSGSADALLHMLASDIKQLERAIERVREEGFEIAAVTSVLDRLAGGAEAIEAAAGAPYRPLATIDDVYPERR